MTLGDGLKNPRMRVKGKFVRWKPVFIRIKATTLFSICHKLNDLLIQWLLDEELQQISYNSLRQIMIDVNYLENYATDNNKESAEAFIQVHSCSREFKGTFRIETGRLQAVGAM